MEVLDLNSDKIFGTFLCTLLLHGDCSIRVSLPHDFTLFFCFFCFFAL